MTETKTKNKTKLDLSEQAYLAFTKGFSCDAKGKQMKEYAKNIEMYSNKPKAELLGFAYYPLPNMSGFVDTYVSRMPRLKFVFKATKNADNQAVAKLNALADRDRGIQFANYDQINRGANKFAVMSGVGIYKIFSDSVDGYKHHLEAIDPANFFCQPYGGSDLEKHQFCGQVGVMKTESQLKEGVENGSYDTEGVKQLLEFAFDTKEPFDYSNEQRTEQEKRFKILGIQSNDAYLEKTFSMVEAYITYKGTRYYVLFEPKSKIAVRQCPLTEVFESNIYPYVSFAPKEDIANFWAIAPATDIRPICEAERSTVNELINNLQRQNRPTKFYDPDAVDRPPQYLPDFWIPKKKGSTAGINDVYSIMTTPDIVQKGMSVTEFLKNIRATESGITGGVQGNAETDKVGINEMNLYQSATKQDYQNESHEEAVKQLGLRYLYGVREHLSEKIAVQILGKNGLEMQMITKDDADPDFDVIIEDSNKKILEDKQDLVFKQWLFNHPKVIEQSNSKKLLEEMYKMGKYDNREIKEFLQPEFYASKEQIENSENAFNKILEGKKPKIYQSADEVFVKNFADLLLETEGIPEKKRPILDTYLQAITEIAKMNQAKKAFMDIQMAQRQQLQAQLQQGIPTPMGGDTEQMQQEQEQESQETNLQINQPI